MRRGVTLTEILIAAALLAVISASILQLLSVTQRQVGAGEAMLNGGVLAQLVIERIRGQLAMNPRYFRDLTGGAATWSHTGTAVDPGSAVTPGGLPISPFVTHLFTRDDPNLCAPANQAPIKTATAATATGIQPNEMTALLESFRDLRVTVEISNDANLTTPPVAGLEEMVKRIQVTVARSSVVAIAGKDPLAFTLTSRVPTPAESLTDAAYAALCARFEPPTLAQRYAEYYMVAGDNVYLTTGNISGTADNVLADAFLLLADANNEALSTQGLRIADSTTTPPVPPTTDFVDSWIAQLEVPAVYALSSSKRELAHLRVRKATTIISAFKRMREPLRHLIEELIGPLAPPRLDLLARVRALFSKLEAWRTQLANIEAAATAANAQYNTAQATLAGLDPADPASAGAIAAASASGDAATASMVAALAAYSAVLAEIRKPPAFDVETVQLSSFLFQLFTHADYAAFFARPLAYPARLTENFAKLSGTLEAHIDQPAGVTHAERTGATRLYVEATAVKQLDLAALDDPAQTRLTGLSAALAPRTADLARYLGNGEVGNLAKLKARHASFDQTLSAMKTLIPRYGVVLDTFGKPGEVTQMLALWTLITGKVNTPDPKDIMSKVNDLLKDLGKLP